MCNIGSYHFSNFPMAQEVLRFWFGVLGLVQWFQGVAPSYHPNSVEVGCFHRLDHIEHEPVFAPQPPKVTGLWTSSRCEIRPGPEFLLRKYKFESNSTFTVLQFFYSDVDCMNPKYSVLATGKYRTVRKSWSIPGGTEVDYQLLSVSLLPYTAEMAKDLDKKVKANCAYMNYKLWQPFQPQSIFNFPLKDKKVSQETLPPPEGVDFDCTHVINFTMHELQLMRLETRLRHPHEAREAGYHILQDNQTGDKISEELFLGDVHTNVNKRRTYRPSSYQTPLKKNKVTSSCGVCLRVGNADVLFPPELRQRHGTMINLSGEWVSTHCEIRPHGIFLTRRLLFSDENSQWEGHYTFFHDPLCREKSYTVYALGNYARGSPSGTISGAREYDFKINQVKVTPNDEKTKNLLNGYEGKYCGKAKSWAVDVEQDVTSTSGCETLGIRLPNIEYDLIKMEYHHWKSHLMIGQRPTDGHPIKSPNRRPTSFQAALVKCDRLYVALAFTKEHNRREISDVAASAADMSSSAFVIVVLWHIFMSGSLV